MKITSQHFSPEVKKPQETEEKTVKVTAESPAAEKAASNAVKTDASRQRMLSWFARVGISPSMMSPDPKKQKHAYKKPWISQCMRMLEGGGIIPQVTGELQL